jgi:thiamine monophosphate synthase
MRPASSRGVPTLMVVTSAGLVAGRGHREVAAAAISGGADAVELRAPELPDHDLLPLAADLARACQAAGTLLVVNDRPDVAEGTLIATVVADRAGAFLAALAADGIEAAVVGEVTEPSKGTILLTPQGEQPLKHPGTDPFLEAFGRWAQHAPLS